MTPRALKTASILAAIGAVLVVTGCGGDKEGKPLPPSQVAELQRQLDSVESRLRVGGGACKDILQGKENNVDAVGRSIDSLPSGVDADVRSALKRSFDRLWELAHSQCGTKKNQPTTPQTTPAPAPPPTVPTETQTDTTPTETTPTETQPKKKPGKDKKAPGNGGAGANE
ncbi:MAG: hypothetical protein ABR581_09310 [Thermoleophilaceae bacterium]